MATAPIVDKPPIDEASLRIGTKIAYGIGDIGAAVTAQVTGFYLTAFLLDVARLDAASVSIIILISNLWEAITDPIVGELCDRTRTRWGRRRPWLLFGAIPFGLAFLLQWIVPPFSGAALFTYYLVATVLVKTMFTVVNVPYTAMTPELAPQYDERTSLTGYRFAFSILGGMTAVFLYPTISGMFPDARTGSFASASLLALFIIASTFTTFAFTRERPIDEIPVEHEGNIIQNLKIAVTNRPFMLLIGIYLLSWLVVQFVQSNLLLYMRYWFGNEAQFRWLVLMLQVTALAFLPVWSWVSHHWGKRIAYYAGMVIFIPVLVSLFFLQPGQLILLYVISFFAGVSVSMTLLIPWSMLPDVVDWDELQTGQRREGVYYGLFVFVQNVGLTTVLALSAWALGMAGYINPEEAGAFVAQPDAVLITLRLVVSWIPAVLLALSVPLVVLYPITRPKFEEIRAAIAARNAANS